MATETFYLVALDETGYYEGPDGTSTLESCIAAAFGLYLVREGERTHICSMTPNSRTFSLGTELVFYADATEQQREELRESYFDDDEKFKTDYFGYMDFATMDKRLYGSPMIVTVDDDDLSDEEYQKVIWEAAEEEAQTNQAGYEPDVLDPVTFREYMLDTRARMNDRRPLQNTHDESLPLFLAAVKSAGMDYAAIRAAHWY